MDLSKPKNHLYTATKDIFGGILVLLIVICIGIFIGVHLSINELSGWGAWLGAFIAGLALVGAIYSVIITTRSAETTNWQIALSRLGEQYDFAQSNEKISKIWMEDIDHHNKNELTFSGVELSAQEIIFFNNLFLSIEQIYIATNSLSAESKRVWRRYIKNQLNKPTIRALFVRDAICSQDYHNSFFEFVRGKEVKKNGATIDYRDYCIHPSYFDNHRNLINKSESRTNQST